LLTPLQFEAQNAVFQLCDRVLCNSRAAAARLLSHGLAEEKVVIIRNGLPASAFAAAAPLLPRQAGVLRVGMVARMNHAVKNHIGFLRAAAALASRFPQVEFVLAGDGPLRAELEHRTERLGLGRRLHFLGDCKDIPAVFASLDVSIVASHSESLSNAILESMAAGVPVVATRAGGTPEVVEDQVTGWLVPPGDDERLTEAIAHLLSNPDLRKACGERSRQFALANFSMDHVHEEVERLYATLLEQKGRKTRQRVPFKPVSGAPTRAIRVAIVAASSRYIGGHSVQAELLTNHWNRDGAVEAKYLPIDPEFPSWLSGIERLPYLRTLARVPFYWAQLWRELARTDVAHIFSASYWSFLLAPVPAWLIGRLRGAKILVHYHSGEAEDHLRRSKMARFALQRADRLVVPSGYLVEVFRRFGLEARPVPNIVSFSQFAFRLRRPLEPLLICTRGFEPYYSVDLVVRAFAKVKAVYPQARLLLVGRGSLEAEVRALVHHLKLENVEFAGAVSREKIGALYNQADIFMNASWLDNMPVSILEAFACGTPVVSTAPEGIRYMVEHERTGLLCAPGDWNGLAENVLRLLREPDLAATLAKNAYQEAHKYRWEAVRQQWFEIYAALVH
jgi:glycosyltransferase involved in cell wall biosynthesis